MVEKKVVVATEFNFQGNVIDQITSAVLAALTPAQGDRYIVTDGANQYKIAMCTTGGASPVWEYITPTEGFLVWDNSDDKFYKYISSWTELSPAETTTTIATIINGSSADTPLDADEWCFRDNVDSILKKITWTNIKATLKTYFDTLYFASTSIVDYAGTSTIVGFSDFTMKILAYCKIGNVLVVRFYFQGTSNSTEVTFTLPYSSIGTNNNLSSGVKDNNSWLTSPGLVQITNNSYTIHCYKTMGAAAFTASGNKAVNGTIVIFIN